MSVPFRRPASSATRRSGPNPGRTVFTRAGLSGLAVAVLTTTLLGAGGAVIQADPAAAADDELTSSAVTLTNEDDALVPDGAPFPDLKVTISQTKDLISQGIRVSWTGGERSSKPQTTNGGANFLQIAQCWGEDPDNLGHPDRRTCQYGGTGSWGARREGAWEPDTAVATIPAQDRPFTDLRYSGGITTEIPFVAVNSAGIVDEEVAPGDRVLSNLTTDANGEVVYDPHPDRNLSSNKFYSEYTTNEVKWAPSGADGSGSVPFEVQTAMQSTALGCGAPVPQADGSARGQSCWLVIIPRGVGDSGSKLTVKPGVWWDAWEHHLAVKLEFKPLGVRCQIGAAERQLAGSELIGGAIGSWQPRLCLGDNGSPFVLSQGNEADALVRAAGTEPSPLAFSSRPLDMSRVGDATDPVAYAPVAVSGLAISFAIDRSPHPQDASADEQAREGLPLTELRLTPRLVAKLLTGSYFTALPDRARADRSHIGYKSAADAGKNPRNITFDPEFREINDQEWAHQLINSPSVADLLVPSGRSDLAVRLWEYVLADTDARAWLDGIPDKWGMVVNPWYSTNSDLNLAGQALALPADSFPKADPIEAAAQPSSSTQSEEGVINLVTWRPYTHDFGDAARNVLRGDGKTLGNWDNLAVPPKFVARPPELFGTQQVMGLTTAPAAALYQTVTASLRNPAGEFVAPTQESLAAAAAAMTPTSAQPKVLAYDPAGAAAKAATTAYPLTMPVYAAVNPKQTDAGQRAAYANLIRFAAGEGQNPGTDIGELPPGYAPLPRSWVDQALAAAAAIERGSLEAAQGSGDPGGSPAGRTTPPQSSAVITTGAAVGIDPVATGDVAGDLAGAVTPDDPETGPLAAAVPIGIGAGLTAALAVPVISRIRRRM